MADVWSLVLFVGKYDGLPIEILSTRDSFRRALVRHEYPNRDGARVDDMGSVAREVDVRIIFRDPMTFDETAPADYAAMDHVDRSRLFIDACNQGSAREFVHPLYGSFPAMIESLEVSAEGEQRDRIEIQARVVEQGIDPAPLLSQTARQLEGGAPSVELEAAAATGAAAAGVPDAFDQAEADDVGAVAAGAVKEAKRWEADPDLDPRSVTVGLGKTSDEIDRLTTELDLLADVEKYPTYRALLRLAYQMQRAAAVVTRNAPALIELVTAAASPLGAILADVYGAAGATEHRDEVISLNDIRDPVLIDAGTRLTLPTPRQVRAQRTRRQGPAYARP
jgi:prophage DNA circulation protein